jgi:hypothetical protein
MQELKATKAREIDKASVTEAESLLVDGALSTELSEPVMQAGDFYFRNTFVSRKPDEPIGFFKRLVWQLSGKARKSRIEIKAISSIVMSCPFCGLPIMTSTWQHHITSRKPLTITESIWCPYASLSPALAHAFRITEGNITALQP